MIEINLVPDVKQQLIRAQRVRTQVITGSVIVGVISVGIVVVLAIYVFGAQTLRSAIADNSIKSGAAKLTAVKDLSKTLTIQNQLTKIDDLTSQKPVDSRLFDVLTAIEPPAPNTITISSVSIDSASQTISINGQSPSSYSAVEIFKKSIASALVKYTDKSGSGQSDTLASNISTSNVSYGDDSTGTKVLQFTISFTYVPSLFDIASNNVSITVPDSGNVTDSSLGVPKSIFGAAATSLGGQ